LVRQKDQTQHFFEAFAANWQSKALGEGDVYNIVEGRHQAALAVLNDLPNPRRVIDVGCGTGQLAISIAARGIAAEGVDFAPAMVGRCERNARRPASTMSHHLRLLSRPQP
jgi:2-polyprenyl-3-methyl-5-hydroxy-6-metoxy-1,4-benzoquinol methylase